MMVAAEVARPLTVMDMDSASVVNAFVTRVGLDRTATSKGAHKTAADMALAILPPVHVPAMKGTLDQIAAIKYVFDLRIISALTKSATPLSVLLLLLRVDCHVLSILQARPQATRALRAFVVDG